MVRPNNNMYANPNKEFRGDIFFLAHSEETWSWRRNFFSHKKPPHLTWSVQTTNWCWGLGPARAPADQFSELSKKAQIFSSIIFEDRFSNFKSLKKMSEIFFVGSLSFFLKKSLRIFLKKMSQIFLEERVLSFYLKKKRPSFFLKKSQIFFEESLRFFLNKNL